jgi:hypothetical protein
MATNIDYVIKRLEAMEAELAQLRRLLSAKPTDQPSVTLGGLWKGIDVTEEEIEEVTHPQRRIEGLKAENEALRRELEHLSNRHPPTPREV